MHGAQTKFHAVCTNGVIQIQSAFHPLKRVLLSAVSPMRFFVPEKFVLDTDNIAFENTCKEGKQQCLTTVLPVISGYTLFIIYLPYLDFSKNIVAFYCDHRHRRPFT